MRRAPAGYTILEVMIFLVISMALLVTSMKLVSGKQEETQFNEKMRDVKSQIDAWYNDVSNGFPGGSVGSQYCKIVNNRPQIYASARAPANYSPDCIFLGKAIQFLYSPVEGQADKLYAYSVFGNSTTSTGDLPTSLASTNPAPAVNQAGVDTTETFLLDPAYIQSVSTTPATSPADRMIGFFSSFNTEKSSVENGSTDVNFYGFNFTSSDNQAPANQGDNAARQCLEISLPSDKCASPQLLQSYTVCFTDGHHLAKLVISSTNGTSVSTNLSYPTACP